MARIPTMMVRGDGGERASTDERLIAIESAGVVRQLRDQLEGRLAGAKVLVIACSDPVDRFDALANVGVGRPLVLRVRSSSLVLSGVREAVALAVDAAPLERIVVLGHSGCHHAVGHCPDLVMPADAGPDEGIMGRLTRGVVRHERMIEAARRTVRAQVRALSTMETLKPALLRGSMQLRGAVLLVESGLWPRGWQHYDLEADIFWADPAAPTAA